MEPPPCSKKSLSLSLPGARDGQATLRPPQHLWRQPRTPIRIQQRGYSDNTDPERGARGARGEPERGDSERERAPHRPIERADAVDTSDRPGLRKSRMSWPSSFHGTSASGSSGGGKRTFVLTVGGRQIGAGLRGLPGRRRINVLATKAYPDCFL